MSLTIHSDLFQWLMGGIMVLYFMIAVGSVIWRKRRKKRER